MISILQNMHKEFGKIFLCHFYIILIQLFRYSYQVDEMMKTPMSEPCNFAVPMYKHPFLLLSFFESGQYFAIYAKTVAAGVYKWVFSNFNYKGIEIKDANLNV